MAETAALGAMGDTTTVTEFDDAEKQKKPKPSNRKNMGRNARRRRQKVLAIEAAAAQAAIGNTTSLTDSFSTTKEAAAVGSPSILPQDRGYLWPAVKDLCTLSEFDKQALIAQLGYLPGNALKVVARVKDHFPSLCNGTPGDEEPLALQLYPLVLRDESDSTKSHRKRRRRQESNETARDTTNGDDLHPSQESEIDSKANPLVEPFPTMYWVTHPRFRALISKLELSADESSDGGGGSIKQFEDRLQKESESLDSMKRAHGHYGQERYDLITKEDWKFIQDRKWEVAFSPARGVAGIRNPSGIKCLHSHTAHYWSGCKDNVVGQWTSEQVQRLLDVAQSSKDVTS